MSIQLGFGFWIVLVLVTALAILVLWMRWRMRASKSRFALAVLTALLTCLSIGIVAATAGLPQVLLAWALTRLGLSGIDIVPSFVSSVLFVAFAGFVAFLIYRFGSTAIKNWEGPLRVSEQPLAENLQDGKLVPLAVNGLVTLWQRIQGQKDLPASAFRSDWRNEDPQLPHAVPTQVLLRDLFLGCYAEAELPDDGWRDASNLWVGTIADPGGKRRTPLLLLICREVPTEETLEDRLKTLSSWTQDKNSCAFAVYPSDRALKGTDFAFVSADREVRVLSGRSLVMNSLDLDFYARQLLSRFASVQIGGTQSTLEDTYVDLTVTSDVEGNEDELPVFDLLKNWENEESRRHLAITGEYGQGKSSAMLKYCADWAKSYLRGEADAQRVPLLIELRGRNPSENDPISFLSAWCVRSRLDPNCVFNLIRSGHAIVIFEGFDELRGAGREYDRHQHFNALWRFAYDGGKIIFTGRPNFFIDDIEANRTLRNNDLRGADGGAHTSVYRLNHMSAKQITAACRGYPEDVRDGIAKLIGSDDNFAEILSRPSMLPVVATIWPKVEEIVQSGDDLNGATLIGLYIDAVFLRKETELEKDKIEHDAPSASRYLLFSVETRKVLTGGIAWLMAEKGYQNTIARSEIKEYVTRCYDSLFANAKADTANPQIAKSLTDFEPRYSHLSLADRVELIVSDICSAGLLVPDPVGGEGVLRFAHKQFYEYFVAWVASVRKRQGVQDPVWDSLVQSRSYQVFEVICSVQISCKFYCQILGDDLSSSVDRFLQYQIAINIIVLNILRKVENGNRDSAINRILKTMLSPYLGVSNAGEIRIIPIIGAVSRFRILLIVIILTGFVQSILVVIMYSGNIPTESNLSFLWIIGGLYATGTLFLASQLYLQYMIGNVISVCTWGKRPNRLQIDDQILICHLLVPSSKILPSLGLSDAEIRSKVALIRSHTQHRERSAIKNQMLALSD